jgi:D-3-phosphoglycerate dehydrogenase/C-terminal binding protein
MADSVRMPPRSGADLRRGRLRAHRDCYRNTGARTRFRTVFPDPYVAVGYDKAIGVARAAHLDELLEQADVLSLHTPLNEETRHLIDTPQLRRMQPSAYLVNTARGGVVRHAALLAALAAGELAGAGLDVLENEPQGMEELLRFPNVIVTPHSAFYSQESILEMRRKSALIVRDALMEGRLRNVVNRPGVRA